MDYDYFRGFRGKVNHWGDDDIYRGLEDLAK